MTDTENTPVCRAQYLINKGGPWDCVLSENHVGPHRDEDGDTWDITYRDVSQCPVTAADGFIRCSQRQGHEGSHTGIHSDAPAKPFVLKTRPVQDQVTDLTARVGLLEAAWTVGGETLSERLDRIVLGITEQIRVHRHPASSSAVTLSTDEYTALLEDREELHALRNQAQSNVTVDTSVDDQHRANHNVPYEDSGHGEA